MKIGGHGVWQTPSGIAKALIIAPHLGAELYSMESNQFREECRK